MEDELEEGQEVEVVCTGRDARGHVKVSRKALLAPPGSSAAPLRSQQQQQPPPPPQQQQQRQRQEKSNLQPPTLPPPQEPPAAQQQQQRSPGAGARPRCLQCSVPAQARRRSLLDICGVQPAQL